MKKTLILCFAITALSLGSCSKQLIYFTSLSTVSNSLQFANTRGMLTVGKHLTFLGIGSSAQIAAKNALQNAGTGYDILLDGRIIIKDYFFVFGYQIEGRAVSSKNLVSELGQEGYAKFLAEHEVMGIETEGHY